MSSTRSLVRCLPTRRFFSIMERVQYQRYLHSTGENAPAPQDESLEGGGLVIDQALIQSSRSISR